MNIFTEIFLNYILPALGILFSALVTWGSTMLIKFLNTKIKNKELAAFATTIVTVVTQAVQATYQSYVEGIKGTEVWTKDAQEKALQMALDTAKNSLTVNALNYIKEQHGDIDTYLKTLIESILYSLKNGNKANNTNIKVENQTA